MNFTGQQLIIKRNFYTQNNNFELDINFSVDNPTGIYEIGLTGNSSLSLLLQSGRISYNNIFLHSYLPNYQYNVNINITDNSINLSKDNTPLAYALYKQTGNYSYFFFK